MTTDSPAPFSPVQPGFDFAVVIGRFQPFHNGHAALLEFAFQVAHRVVLVLGSASTAPSPRNPFSAPEREQMIRRSLDADGNARLFVIGQRDVWDTQRWAKEVSQVVGSLASGSIALVGYHKDDSSSYLESFPHWTLLDVGRCGFLDATPLRESLLSDRPSSEVLVALRTAIPPGTFEWIEAWAMGPVRDDLTQESISIRRYREKWGSGPFLAAHALVRWGDAVLLQRRDHRPGYGLWEMPGDFLLPDEQLESGARRALREQTGIDLQGVRPSAAQVFAHPGRSLRGRIVTHAFLYEPQAETVPPVLRPLPSRETRWVTVGQIPSMESAFFEDHFHIADDLLGRILTG